MLVNDQLNQLYIEMELEGLSTKLTLEEGITLSSSGDEISTNSSKVIFCRRRFVRSLIYHKMCYCSLRKKEIAECGDDDVLRRKCSLPSPNKS
jgi:hypothetical protein